MSAFILDVEHIHTLLMTGLEGAPLRWYFGNPTHCGELTADTASAVGQMLIDANIASVDHRYRESNIRIEYTYRRLRHAGWNTGELLSALHGYEHQACETPDWTSSEAYAFCRELERKLIRRVPGYTDGPWAISPTVVPPERALRSV